MKSRSNRRGFTPTNYRLYVLPNTALVFIGAHETPDHRWGIFARRDSSNGNAPSDRPTITQFDVVRSATSCRQIQGNAYRRTSNDSTDTCVADQRIKQLSIIAARNDLGTYRTCPKATR